MSAKEKLLELRGKVDIDPDWQSLREMETTETANLKLDKEEQELLDSFENGEWRRVANAEAEIRWHQQYARNTLKKDKRVNIRLSSKDLEELQAATVRQGILIDKARD